MRDPELLLQLLREMAEQPNGRIPMALTMDDDKRVHHMLLLVDTGLASWRGNLYPRITSAGYDFIAAYDKDPQARQKFWDLLEKAMPYAQTVNKVLEMIG